jgi:TolB-like protein/Tfp pilus assembly protein PilF
MSTSIDGLCAACLMRLATADDSDNLAAGMTAEADRPASSGLPRYDEWLRLKGQRIGQHELLDEIARGGMGIVYRARHLTAGRVVALKVMLPYLLTMPGMILRFRQEVEAAAQLDHPGILPIYEVGEHDGLPYFSMKYADGGTLSQRAASLAGDWVAIARLMAKVARAVHHAHERGVLHRDLKPANILLDAHDEPLVADFGLAKFRASNRALTLPASALGSPNYMAPEQISAEFGEVGPACDIYSLGAVLYELLTGRPPIVGEDALATLRLVPTREPESGVRTRPDLPPDLDAIARKCLAKKPSARYPTAAEVADDLQRWERGGSTAAKRQARARTFRVWAAAVCAVALLGGAGTLLALRWPESDSRVAPEAARRSVAVLPFRNNSGNPDDDYLGFAVTDDLLRDLRQIETLSVLPFRVPVEPGSELRLTDLAESLGVRYVLAGDFSRGGEGVLVHAQLWDASTGRSAWSHTFTAKDGDVREVRAQIATNLVTQLQVEIGTDLREQFTRDALTASPSAYRNYLRGRYLLRWRRPETLAQAARVLREAIDEDPNFARAHSALAYLYALWIGPPPPEGDHWTLALQYARSTIALDDSLGEPYAVLGDYYDIHGKMQEGEASFQGALARDPRDPASLHLYAIHLYSVGRLKSALEMERRSVALDSTSPQPMMWLAMLTTTVGDQNEARRLWQKAEDLGTTRPLCAAVSRLSLGENSYLPEWYRTNAKEAGIPESRHDTDVLAAGVIDPTRRDAALQWMRSLEPKLNPAFAITHYAMLADADSAYRVASNYQLVDDFFYLYQLCNIWSPRTAIVRRDPRFGELMQRWGFVDYWNRYGMSDFCKTESGALRCE